MKGRVGDLDTFLRTDPRDVGCEEVIEMLHVYADLHAADPEDARARYPGIDVHLRSCGPCLTDFEGLLELISG
ncbi:zf-HC2 domain-containing protein [Paractinoplanes toevensis]|uniref:Uncharacterized protein n=1 Tax=Paractinoplanes toevensis TaxID=571911 RepID=A0A919TEN0_9ACTN|nr:zf-HC2 domain-containing protein [Actinoplanes toevensis]GIM93010.1 hypothetical protein Ato02nite_048030 [Actinoplanes toevensis]